MEGLPICRITHRRRADFTANIRELQKNRMRAAQDRARAAEDRAGNEIIEREMWKIERETKL